MLARSLARNVALSLCLSSSTLVVVRLGQVTDLTGIGAHLRANRCGARLVKTVNSCEGETVGSLWGAAHVVHDNVIPILDRYRLGHQPVISTWPYWRKRLLRLVSAVVPFSTLLLCRWAGCCQSADLDGHLLHVRFCTCKGVGCGWYGSMYSRKKSPCFDMDPASGVVTGETS